MWVLKSLKVIISWIITRMRKIFKPQYLSFLLHPIIYVCAKILRKTSMVEPFSWLWWLEVEPLLIAIMTGKMFWPRISLKIGRFGPGFQWSKSRTFYLEREWAHVWPISIAPFLNTNVSNWGVSRFEECDFFESKHVYSAFIVEIANLIWVC